MSQPNSQDKTAAYTQKDAIQNVNRLTLAFAQAAAKCQDDKSDNLVVSPYNALQCLSMVTRGADKNTKVELMKALFATSADNANVATAVLAVLNDTILDANKGQVELKSANGIWANKDLGIKLNKIFVNELKEVFGAEISEESFGDPATVKKINQWASDNTNKLINEIVEQLGGDDLAILASSLYFKGKWTHVFDKKETEDRVFTLDGGETVTTPTMRQVYEEDQVRYRKGEDYEAVALTYGESKQREGKYPTMRIVLIRPTDAAVSARDWLSAQTENAAWMKGYFEGAEGSVELPRIDIKQKHDVKAVLQAMGVQEAFAPGGADFSPMTESGTKRLYVSEVTQDVVFKTDEEGSEAAAVTMARMTLECVRMPPQKIDVQFDRSFVFALQDVKTNAVLFIGAVNKPNKDLAPAPKGSAPKA